MPATTIERKIYFGQMSKIQPIIISLSILFEIGIVIDHPSSSLPVYALVSCALCRLESVVADQRARNRCIIAFALPHLMPFRRCSNFHWRKNAPEICSFREWQSNVCVSVIRVVGYSATTQMRVKILHCLIAIDNRWDNQRLIHVERAK